MKNNKGFSLAELVVAIAILSVIMLAVGSMLSSGSSLFSNLTKSEKTSGDMQTALEQIQGYVMDCSAIYFKSSSNPGQILVGDVGSNIYYQIYKSSKNNLAIAKKVWNGTNWDGTDAEKSTSGTLCADIDDLVYTLSYKKLDSPLLTIKLTVDGQTETLAVTLRNVKSANIYTSTSTFQKVIKGVS